MTRSEMVEYNNLLKQTQKEKTVMAFKFIPLSLRGSEILSANFIVSLVATLLVLPHTYIPNHAKMVMGFYIAIVQLIWWNTKIINYPFLDDKKYYKEDLLVHITTNTPAYVSKVENDNHTITVIHEKKYTIENLSHDDLTHNYYYVMPNSLEFSKIKPKV